VCAVARHPRLPVELFRFATTERAELNTAVLYAFEAANERLETWLTLGDVATRLQTVGYFAALTDEDLVPVLDQLRDWQLIDRTQDHAAHYSTAEDFERNNLRYSLTRRGEAALEGFSRAAAVLEATGALQTAVLDAIAERLDELAAMLTDPTATDRRVYSTLAELEGHLESLVAGVKQFNGELQRLLRDDSGVLETFQEVMQATVAYLQEFVTNLDHRQRTIAAAIARDGLRAWFRPADGSAPRAAALQDVARRAIVALMRVLERHTEARRRACSAAADFRALARAFAACPTSTDAHRLAAAAFGLGPARHTQLGLADEDLVPAATPWADAPRVPVSPHLRSRGRVEQSSRTAAVRDVHELRRARQHRAAHERAELEAAWGRLSTAGPVRLSSLCALEPLGILEPGRFERLLELLGRALSAPPDATGHRRGMSTDGRVELVLRAPADGSRGHPAHSQRRSHRSGLHRRRPDAGLGAAGGRGRRVMSGLGSATRPLRRDRSTRSPFDRRRYTLLAIVCAELLATPVTTIGLLADRVTHATAAEPGIESFQTARRAERGAFVDALKLLERAGALRALDGTAESYLDSDTAKVLFQVDTTLLLRLLAAPQAPSAVDLQDPTALTLLTREPRYGAAPAGGEAADAQRNLWLRHSITGRCSTTRWSTATSSPRPSSAISPAPPGSVWSGRPPSRLGSSSKSGPRATCSSSPTGWPPTSVSPTTRRTRKSPRWYRSIISLRLERRSPTVSWSSAPSSSWNGSPAGPRPTAPRTGRPGSPPTRWTCCAPSSSPPGKAGRSGRCPQPPGSPSLPRCWRKYDGDRPAAGPRRAGTQRTVTPAPGGHRQHLALPRRGVRLPPRPAAAARRERHRQVQGAGAAAALPARRQPAGTPAVHLRQ